MLLVKNLPLSSINPPNSYCSKNIEQFESSAIMHLANHRYHPSIYLNDFSLEETLNPSNDIKAIHIDIINCTKWLSNVKLSSSLKAIKLSSSLALPLSTFKELLQQCPNLETIIIDKNISLSKDPEFILANKRVSSLEIAELTDIYCLFSLIGLKELKWVKIKNVKPTLQKVIYKLFKIAHQRNYSIAFKKFSLSILLQDFEHLTAFPEYYLIRLLEYNCDTINKHLILFLEQRVTNLSHSSQIYLPSTIDNYTEISCSLDDENIQYNSTLSSDTTHIVFAETLNSALFHKSQAKLILLQDLSSFIQSRGSTGFFLQEEDSEELIDYLSNLLLNPDPITSELGFQLLDSGGFPKQLLTDMFIISQEENRPDTLKEKAMYYLKLHANSTLQTKLHAEYTIFEKSTYYVDEGSEIQDLLTNTELSPYKLLKYIFLNYQKGLCCIFKSPFKDLRIIAWNKLIENGKLELLRICDIVPAEAYEDLLSIKQPIHHIRLRNCSEIPNAIFQLKELKHLDIADNDMKSIPEEIGLLQNLESLNMANNNLHILPKSFSKLTMLKTLNIKQNLFPNLPAEIIELRQLKCLHLRFPFGFMAKRSLFKGLENLENLEELYLAKNYLSFFPEEIYQLSKLKTLDFAANKIKKVDTKLFKMSNLKEVSFSLCPLKESTLQKINQHFC